MSRDEAIKAASEARDQFRGTKLKQGTDTADSILARLKRDNPELAERAIRGEITANAAARIMGWRKPRVLLTSPESVARKLREFFTEEELNELKELL